MRAIGINPVSVRRSLLQKRGDRVSRLVVDRIGVDLSMGHMISLLIKEEEKEGFLILDYRRFGLCTARRRRLKSRLPTLACEEVVEDPRPADSMQTRHT